MISDDEFMVHYAPLQQTSEGDYMIPSFDEAMAKADRFGGIEHLWTVVEGDGGELVLSPGRHLVNQLGYFVTEVPWKTGLEDVLWFEIEGDDEDDDLVFSPGN